MPRIVDDQPEWEQRFELLMRTLDIFRKAANDWEWRTAEYVLNIAQAEIEALKPLVDYMAEVAEKVNLYHFSSSTG